MTLTEYLTTLLTAREPTPREVRSAGPSTGQSNVTARVIYECRRCGTSVTDATSACPYCNRQTIAEYPVD